MLTLVELYVSEERHRYELDQVDVEELVAQTRFTLETDWIQAA